MRVLAQITPSAPWGIPMVYTHYVPAFAKYDEEQGYQAVCGAAAADDNFSTEPTCPDCQAWLDAPSDASGRPIVDPLSHVAQTIHVASGELLDLALQIKGTGRAKSLHTIAVGLRERLDAIVAVSAQPDEPDVCPFL